MHGTIFLFEQKFWIAGLHNPVLQLIHFKEKRVFPMKYNTCPQCKTKVSDDLAQCPECGHSFGTRKNDRIPVVFGSCLLIAAFAVGLAFNLGSELHNAVPSAAPEIIETLAPATPVPTPTVDSIEVYAFGRELDADGFTAYVGDKPFTLSAYPQPEISHPQISWSVGDSVELSVSSDTLTCEFTALKPTGKNELTVRCYGAEVTIPVYLWER
jgi:hypothetical protein